MTIHHHNHHRLSIVLTIYQYRILNNKVIKRLFRLYTLNAISSTPHIQYFNINYKYLVKI